MKKICSLLLLTINFLAVYAQKETKTVTYAAGKLSMSVPATQDTMTADNIWTKYHKTPNGKTKYLANSDFSFSIVLDEVASNKVTEAQMIKHKDDILLQIQASHELIENQVLTVNGHQIIVVSFISEVPSGKIFNRRFFAVADSKLVMVSFNITEEDLVNRKAQIENSIRSVQIK